MAGLISIEKGLNGVPGSFDFTRTPVVAQTGPCLALYVPYIKN